jgi:DNA-binding transcriptional ArsR family regulator
MVGVDADMAETPDEILRALADPERLRIAGALAAGDAAAATLAESLHLPLARVRRHLTRLAASGVARLQPDRRTYRLDPETLRWAAEQVGPPREAGIALAAANEDEETILRTFFRNGRLTEIPMKASKRRVVLERIASEFEPPAFAMRNGRSTRSSAGSLPTTRRSAATSSTRGSSLARPASTGGRAVAWTSRRGRPPGARVGSEPPSGTFPSAVRRVRRAPT